MTLQDRIWASRINFSAEEIQEDHMIGKSVIVAGEAGTVTKELAADATGEVYEVEFEDGSTKEIPVGNMELATESCNNNTCNESVKDSDEAGTVENELEEGGKEEYEKFFKSALKKFGVDSPADLEDDKKKEFFDYIDKEWKGDKEED